MHLYNLALAINVFMVQIFVMYHGTTLENAIKIIQSNRFKVSAEALHDGRMLGDGIYASSTFAKARKFGDVILKILVYPGRICVIRRKDHPLQKTWHQNFGSAWVPHNTPGLARIQVLALVSRQSNLQISV